MKLTYFLFTVMFVAILLSDNTCDAGFFGDIVNVGKVAEKPPNRTYVH